MWIVAGLGNPGTTYARTRHNAGFMVVDALARRWRFEWSDGDAAVRAGRGRVNDELVMLVQPLLFMNRSGDAVARLEPVADAPIVVVYDDLDLPPGQIRVRPRGGSGGHLGLTSMIDSFGRDLIRVRVGIGRPPVGVEPADYVLEPLGPDAAELLQPAIERAGDAVECIITAGTTTAMNRFNVRPDAGPE